VIAYCGAIAPEAMAAHQDLLEDIPGAGLLAITSPDRLHADWMSARQARRAGNQIATAHVEDLLDVIADDAALVTVCDAQSATLGWLGSVAGHRIYPLGVDTFGQSGDLQDLYAHYGIDSDAILDAAARACIRRLS
jgi:pyruvate dehydrogenase E1 component